MKGPVVLRARHVFPVTSPPLSDAYVSISNGRITSVGQRLPDGPVTDLGDVAIVPGLVNAHTHLEFSDLDRPLGTQGIDFADWIPLVIQHRQERISQVTPSDDSGSDRPPISDSQDAVAAGLAECLRHGVTCVGDIAAPHESSIDSSGYPEPSPSVTVFRELIGLSDERAATELEAARSHLAGQHWTSAEIRPGLSPHAPYTVAPDLLAQVVRLAAESRVPVTMHLAESFAEIELLASHCGSLVDLLTQMDVWEPAAVPRGIRPLDYLKYLAEAQRALVVHGNFLDDEEVEFLAERRDSMSLVYCPRTHAYFDHGVYPLAARLAAGANVCLGTDSRASNPDLSILAEMRFVALNQANVAPGTILEMATRNGARALGQADQAGSLEVGKTADLTVLRLPEQAATDPHELLFDPTCEVEAIYRGGRRITADTNRS
jgi:cytosine/adenosine deaminase-related metal-dependent hydrolase